MKTIVPSLARLEAAPGAYATQALMEDAGLAFSYICIGDGGAYTLPLPGGTACLFIIVCGRGRIRMYGTEYAVDGMAFAYALPGESRIEIQADESAMRLLELRCRLRAVDLEECVTRQYQPCGFMVYEKCPTYREAIKSPKTVNRTVLPEHFVPRLCIGSVETEGPDSVGAHRHPMLEQFFFGLPGNDCTVFADNESLSFGENMLLCIPSGSLHGVEVAAGCRLHYLWIDLFSTGDVSYIAQNHLTDDPNETQRTDSQ